jgi:thioredoxin 1
MNTTIINVKTLDEYSHYLKSNTYVVANFSASFCKPCKEIAPFIEELVINYPNITFLKIDIEEGSEISDYHNISSIPYFKFYKKETEIASYCGTDKRIIQETLENMTSMYL